jgi:hypothetical protein
LQAAAEKSGLGCLELGSYGATLLHNAELELPVWVKLPFIKDRQVKQCYQLIDEAM